MEGFLDIRLAALAAAADHPRHRHHPGGRRDHLLRREQETGKLLILTQVILSVQLPFAVVPLVQFTADRAKMGRWLTPLMAGGLRRPDRRLASSR